MQVRLALLGIGLGLLGAGCSLVQTATGVITTRVKESWDECAERRRNARWAEEAWEHVGSGAEGCNHSEDYADGFKTAFADFLYHGGDGEPPPLPPGKYRALRYQTAEGYHAVEDWFAGFRHGAATAREGGHRRWVTGATSLHAAVPPADVPAPQPAPQPAPPEVLPAPRRVTSQWVPGPDAAPESAPALLPAEFRFDADMWRVSCDGPDGEVTALMSTRGYTEFMKTVRRRKQDHRHVGGRHPLTATGGGTTTVTDLDDATCRDVAAYLKWYYEDFGQQ
jgi:hypothetical protein